MLHNGDSKEALEAKKQAAFEALKEQLQAFLNEFCNPHHVIIAEQGSVQLCSGERAMPLDIPD